MKKYKITITTVLELPDDFQIANDPDGPTEGALRCFKRGSRYYEPTISWMQRHHYFDLGFESSLEGPPPVGWESVNDDTANEFINACVDAENYLIEQGGSDQDGQDPAKVRG